LRYGNMPIFIDCNFCSARLRAISRRDLLEVHPARPEIRRYGTFVLGRLGIAWQCEMVQ